VESRRLELMQLLGHLESLQDREPPLDVTACARWGEIVESVRDASAPIHLGRVEDEIDAYLCAYIAQYFWTHGATRCRIAGDVETGYIVTPVSVDQGRYIDRLAATATTVSATTVTASVESVRSYMTTGSTTTTPSTITAGDSTTTSEVPPVADAVATSVQNKEFLMGDEIQQEKRGLYLLHIDGGKKASAVGEMGEGAIAAVLKEPNGTAISGAALSERVGPVESPTAAEYRALLRGLQLARERGVKYLAIFSDSRILVNQMNRLWNAGDSLAPLRDEAEEALRNFKGTQVSWIPRKWNEEADALVNKAFGPRSAEVIHSQDVPELDRAFPSAGREYVSGVADLERLAHLHANGSLTDAEFAKAKAQVLDR